MGEERTGEGSMWRRVDGWLAALVTEGWRCGEDSDIGEMVLLL